MKAWQEGGDCSGLLSTRLADVLPENPRAEEAGCAQLLLGAAASGARELAGVAGARREAVVTAVVMDLWASTKPQ